MILFVQSEVSRVLEVVNVVVVGEGLELPRVLLTAGPEVTERFLTIGRPGLPVDDVVLRLVLQATVMKESLRAGAVQDVVLEECLPGGDVAVEKVSTAVVWHCIPAVVRFQVEGKIEEKVSR